MQTFEIKKEKWHQSNYSIYQNGQLIGELTPEGYKKDYELSLRGKAYSLKRVSIWKEDKEYYLGDIKIGDVQSFNWKDQTVINLTGKGSFLFKTTNTWKGIKTLFNGAQEIGESKSKSFAAIFTVADEIEDNLLAAMMFTTMRHNNSWVAFVALIPIWIVTLT